MRLQFREKQSLYHSLGQLLRSGVTFPAALRTLSPSARGSLKQLLARLNHSIEGGATVAEAFAAQRPVVSEMELGVVAAVERAGRLDHGLAQLAEYFGALHAARAAAQKRLAYPLFLLHFGILIMGVQTLVARGLGAYLREVGGTLGLLYAGGLVLFLAMVFLVDAAATSALVDAVLRRVPLVGGIRENFAVARFCATYEMQMRAGVNVLDALRAAARASRSGLTTANINRALPEILAGAQVGAALSGSPGFPEGMLRDFTVGEQTGRLDEELARLTTEHQRAAISSLDTLAEWVPRLTYVAICLYVGWNIVSFFLGYFKTIQDLTDQKY